MIYIYDTFNIKSVKIPQNFEFIVPPKKNSYELGTTWGE